MRVTRIAVLLFAGLSCSLHSAVSFKAEVAPLFEKKCLACHSVEKAKGSYRLHNFEALMTPGKSKDAPVTPGAPEKSKLYQLLTATDPDDRMPQKDEPLASKQIELIRKWIAEGAKFDGTDPKALLSDILPEVASLPAPEVYPRAVPIAALVFHGAELVTGGYREALVWNGESGELLQRIGDLPLKIQALSFDAQGTRLTVAGGTPGRKGEVFMIEDFGGARKRIRIARGADLALAVQFSPDGKLLAWSGTDNAIHIFDCAGGKEKSLIQQHADWVLDVNFNSDATKIVSASRDRTARVYNVATGDLEATYTGHEGPVNSAVFTSDGMYAVSGGRDKKLHLWKVADGGAAGDLGRCEGEILRMRTLGDSVFVASTDHLVREFSIRGKKLRRTFSGPDETPYDIAISGTNLVAAGYYSGEVQVWDATSGAPLRRFVAAPLAKSAAATARPK